MDTLSLDDLVLAFRTLTLPKSGWTHRAHLRVGAGTSTTSAPKRRSRC